MSVPPERGAADVERLADGLCERLASVRAGGAELASWRLELSDGWGLAAGLRDSRLGGPYEPPAAARGLAGGLYLRWSDATVTSASLTATTLAEWDELLPEWRAMAYRDPHAPEVLGPTLLPEVAVRDPAVEAVVDGEPGPLLAVLSRCLEALTAAGLRQLDGGAAAASRRRVLRSSRGLDIAYSETTYSCSIGAELLYNRGFSKRRLIEPEELEELLADVAETAGALRQEEQAPSGELPVLLTPGVAGSFVGRFVGTNLSGAAVIHGRSAFRLDDFRTGRQVARDDLSFVIDTTQPLERATSPVSSEGVPGGRVALVEGGRLRTPLLSLKYAAQAGLPPTPVPGGSPGLLVRGAEPERERAECMADLGSGLLVHSVMGMHTQDAVRGRYSLVAPAARVVREGSLGGRCKAILAGSFFEHLLDERTALVRFPWGVNPGMLIWTHVTSGNGD